MPRKTFEVASFVNMCNNILSNEEFLQLHKESVAAVLECVLDKTGNEYIIEYLEKEENFSRKYIMK